MTRILFKESNEDSLYALWTSYASQDTISAYPSCNIESCLVAVELKVFVEDWPFPEIRTISSSTIWEVTALLLHYAHHTNFQCTIRLYLLEYYPPRLIYTKQLPLVPK